MGINWIDSDNEVKTTEESIVDFENKFNIKFPKSYREMLKIHGGEYSEELEEMLPLERVLTMNDYPEYGCVSYMNEAELRNIFLIFEACSGDYYALDYNTLNDNNEPTVIDINHESFLENADQLDRFNSFDEFIDGF